MSGKGEERKLVKMCQAGQMWQMLHVMHVWRA
jgi:hypothetical protein